MRLRPNIAIAHLPIPPHSLLVNDGSGFLGGKTKCIDAECRAEVCRAYALEHNGLCMTCIAQLHVEAEMLCLKQ